MKTTIVPPARIAAWAAATGFALILAPAALAAGPAEALQAYRQESGAAPSVQRGSLFFTSTHGREWSCSSCHTERPVVDGRHASTGKVIAPMAPAVNAERFTDPAKTEKWFRRNCRDVVGRECTAAEKADVLAFLMSLT